MKQNIVWTELKSLIQIMKEADVIITPIAQTDGQIKKRPALLLREMPKYKDYLVCGISSQVRQHLKNFDEIILTTDADFNASGLTRESVIRLSFLAVVSSNNIIGTIGSISPMRYERLLKNLSNYIIKKLSQKGS